MDIRGTTALTEANLDIIMIFKTFLLKPKFLNLLLKDDACLGDNYCGAFSEEGANYLRGVRWMNYHQSYESLCNR